MAKHLIHIGYPKAGSTFLKAWFEQHPDLCYAPGGLGGFRNIYEICRPAEATYEYFVTSCEGIAAPHKDFGTFSVDWACPGQTPPAPIKQHQKQVCGVLSALYPGSTVLIVTRGFKGIIMSSYSQYVRSGGVLNLEEMCRQLAQCVLDDTYQYFDFDYLVGVYAAAFGEGNLIVLPYELLRDDQTAFLSVLEKRLGIAHIDADVPRLNPSLSSEELYWYPLISRRIAALTMRLSEARFRRIYRWYIGQTMKNRLRRGIGILRRLKPERKIADTDFPTEALQYCRGKALLLKDNPLYARYAAEYLWDTSDDASDKTCSA